MQKRIIQYLLVAMALSTPLVVLDKAEAYESITAQEAYDMIAAGEAVMLDVRTLEELRWVGSPALVPGGDPISYAIPWIFININADGSISSGPNPDFQALVEQTFPDFDLPIIAICRSGGRSTSAAVALEAYGYINVYEVDSSDPGGRGGFEGSSYGNTYEGYRGYPERLPSNMDPHRISVKIDTDRIRNTDDSVSWMDTGLPITQKLNPSMIPSLLQ